LNELQIAQCFGQLVCDEDFKKPIVGVAGGYSTITPCNAGLNLLTERAVDALRQASTMPQTFGTISQRWNAWALKE
jgi:dihydroxyacid dehydratase/phosphogluconate dehydratase